MCTLGQVECETREGVEEEERASSAAITQLSTGARQCAIAGTELLPVRLEEKSCTSGSAINASLCQHCKSADEQSLRTGFNRSQSGTSPFPSAALRSSFELYTTSILASKLNLYCSTLSPSRSAPLRQIDRRLQRSDGRCCIDAVFIELGQG